MNFQISVRLYSTSIKKTASVIRKEFLEYFTSNLGHTIVPSSPVVPINDRSLAFVNAGMNQFKGILLNQYNPKATKVVNSQKCIRVGGKHNDLNVVGTDGYHHTFFEMLGSWSFNDYFKEDACRYAWNLLTDVYGINKDFLYVTYFSGDANLGLPPDLETKDIWLNIGVPESKILPRGINDNFWEMGITGPCGTCTEIHINAMMQNNELNQCNSIDLTELWNIVFIQYERLDDGSIRSLSKHHVDTGMGFERLVTLLQGKRSNYDTDLFQPLFEAIQKHSGTPAYAGTFSNNKNSLDVGYRILADHARMVTVALADGMLPEESHKLRRIIRKAIDVGNNIFKVQSILPKLAHVVTDTLGDIYPELYQNFDQVQTILQFEENLLKTLYNTSGKKWKKMVAANPKLGAISDWAAPGLVDGYRDLKSMLKDMHPPHILSGTVAFKLYDTYGLSLETITELAKVESLLFDEAVLQEELQKAKYRSRVGIEHNNILSEVIISQLKKQTIPKTNDLFKYKYTSNGESYEFPESKGNILGFVIKDKLMSEIQIQNKTSNKSNYIDNSVNISKDDVIGIILDNTSCYSVEGGQTSDKGSIRINDILFNVSDVRKANNYVVHVGSFVLNDLTEEETRKLRVGDKCIISIDPENRIGAMRHHTATHLLQAAMKQVLKVVVQRGCRVDTDQLKFQFNSFGKKLTLESLMSIEKVINNIIAMNVPVTTKIVNSLELLSEKDVTLIPGETYPETGIRIVEIETNDLKSKEACCGTHVYNTGDLMHFCITNYASKGSVNNTIKAIVGPSAKSIQSAGQNIQQKISNFKERLRSESTDLDLLRKEVNDLKTGLTGKTEILIPYIVKQECLAELEGLDKTVYWQQKEMEKVSLIAEMTNNQTENVFLVHFFTRDIMFHSLNEIVSFFSNKPVFIISSSKNNVKARCVIPKKMVSDSFNAQMWMETVLPIFNAHHGDVKGFDRLCTASMKSTEVSKDSLTTLIETAVKEATKFALINTIKLNASQLSMK